jgi:tRNA (guanine-N7-)-methyltransferase
MGGGWNRRRPSVILPVMNEALNDILEAHGANRLDRSFPGTVLDMFETRRPLEIEIGAGKGRFLMHRAMEVPEHNFIGFDYIWKYLKVGWQRVQKRGLENVLYFKAEANEVVTHLVPDESIHTFHINFPDPWHKKKHHKRRLLTPEFFKLLHRRLVPGGRLEIATDNFDYMIMFRSSLVEAGDTLWAHAREAKNERILNPEFKTNFELKYEAEGRDLFYLELVK